MVYKVIATDEQLKEIGIDSEYLSKRVVKLGEFSDGYWQVFSQKFVLGGFLFFQYEFHIPKEYLEKVD